MIKCLEAVVLGGDKQWISIRSSDLHNPVLLFVHGGPGSAEIALVRKFNPRLENSFTVVVWDQRGAGKSYSAGADTAKMNIGQFLSDLIELTAFLKSRFEQERIYLMGHSWGSVLGVLAVQAHPEDYLAYIGIGQIVNMYANERLCYRFTMDEAIRRGNKRAQRRLFKIGEPVKGLYREPIKDLLTQRYYLDKFGGSSFGNGGFLQYSKIVLSAPEYSIIDRIRYIPGMRRSLELLWRESLMEIDFPSQATEFRIPVYFCVGRHDYNTPFSLVESYCESIKAPDKKIFWFEGSAHSPNFEEPEAFQDAIISILSNRR
jgi:pimeloyl-ACP methyl ester carboxylesterase